MASTYSPSLRLELMATGDQSGTWGDTTNTNLGTLLEQSITGYLSKAMADTNQTLTSLNGASDEARNMVVEATGALTAGRNMVVPTAEKLYLIKNSTSGGFAVTVKTSAGTGVAVAAGTSEWVYCDGTNVVQGLVGYPLLSSANVFTATQTITSTDAGATVGPVLDLYRNSATPATNDILGKVLFDGEDSAGNTQEYASIEAVISDPTTTAEDGDLDMYATVAGTRRRLFSINSTQALYGRALPTTANNATDPTNDIDFAAGAASDLSTTATGLMWVTCAALTKRLDADWVAGTNQGMRYSGAAIADAWYYLWACWTDAGTQDYYADTSSSQATVLGHLQAEPGGGSYTHLRRIGAILRSTNIVPFFQNGDIFLYQTPFGDVAVTAPGTAAVSRSLNIPPISINALLSLGIVDATADGNTVWYYVSSPSVLDTAPGSGAFSTLALATVGGIGAGSGFAEVPTSNTQIRTRVSASADVTIYVTTLGYIDRRGQ